MINSEIRVETIDHLGIVAGLVDEIGIVEILNKRLEIDSREKVSTGVIIKAMILNGLGFVSATCICSDNSFKIKQLKRYWEKG